MKGVKGLVLAAGLGTRLRPLTLLYPKPLLPVLGSSPLEMALGRLAEAGIGDVAVNSHYLADQVANALAGNPFKQRLLHSHEQTLLGTGGVYNPLRTWLGDDDLVVVNGDVVADFDVQALISQHRSGGFVATMLLLPEVIAGESAVYVGDDRVIAIGRNLPPSLVEAARPRNFACVQILSAQFLNLLPKTGVFDVISYGYQVALAAFLPIGAQLHHGYWHDIRDPQFYWMALKDLMKHRGLDHFVAGNAVVSSAATIGKQVVIEHGARVEGGACLSEAVVLPGAVVVANQQLHGKIVLPAPHACVDLKG